MSRQSAVSRNAKRAVQRATRRATAVPEPVVIDVPWSPPPAVGLTWAPPITCGCGERHHLGAWYYVSVIREPERPRSDMVLAAGPYLTHQEALARVDAVRRVVGAKYQGSLASPWYGYGTVAMPRGTRSGALNGRHVLEA